MENITTYTFLHGTSIDMENADAAFPIQTSSEKCITMDDGTAWPSIVREFTNFLSGIYGYDISAKVFVQDVNWDSGEAVYTAVQDYS